MCCADKVTLFALIVVHSVVGVISAETIVGNDCNTPDNEQGICIDIRRCDHLVAILRRQPLTDEDRNYLRSRQCGFLNGSPLVCCKLPHLQYSQKNLTEDCGVFPTFRILRSFVVYIDEYPWTALIELKDSYNTSKFSCAGALINENFVVVAAHCVNQSNADGSNLTISSVRLGEFDLATEIDCEFDDDCADPPQDIPIAEIIVHEDFSYNSLRKMTENDIALIRLSRPTKFNDFVRPICLPIVERLQIDFTQLDKPFEITGWIQNESLLQSKKSQFNAPYITPSRCNTLYRTDIIDSKQLCTGNGTYGGKTLCQGDTFILSSVTHLKDSFRYEFKHYLAGLFSFRTEGCATDGLPVIYTNVTAYVDWILDHISEVRRS